MLHVNFAVILLFLLIQHNTARPQYSYPAQAGNQGIIFSDLSASTVSPLYGWGYNSGYTSGKNGVNAVYSPVPSYNQGYSGVGTYNYNQGYGGVGTNTYSQGYGAVNTNSYSYPSTYGYNTPSSAYNSNLFSAWYNPYSYGQTITG